MTAEGARMLAFTRAVSPALARCELTHLKRVPIDPHRAEAQHRAYEEALSAAGCRVISLPAEPELPDSVFVEDTAVVLDEVAVLTRPGAPSRRPEVDLIEEVLDAHRPLCRIVEPGCLDGGDVLPVDRVVYVGASRRTNRQSIEQLAALLRPHGYEVRPVPVEGCLHLKSAVTLVAPDTLLVNAAWVDPRHFQGHRLIEVDPSEPFAANALRIGSRVVYPAAFPRTGERLKRSGIPLAPVEVDELAKAEGGVTCCSLVFPEEGRVKPGA